MFEVHTNETHSQHCCSSVDGTAVCLCTHNRRHLGRRVQLNG